MNGLYTKLLYLAGFLALISCQSPEDFSSSPVISPEESLEKIKVEEGFKVELIAAEPLVNSPIALTFDEKGRMWVVEMQSYMLDTLGTGEEQPTGKIVILEDTDKDGTFDQRKVFLDSLIMPRGLSLVENGILIAEPPKLWFVEINHDRPGKKILVDAEYAEGGNVEHQPNGLYRALDNWIYNAKSDKRYRKKGDHWLIERTHFRGQWGISQDDYGRLYYNNNSENLLGDYFAPGLGAANHNQRRVAGFDEEIVPDNRVYPVRPTSGVNRGYMKGILNDSLRLVNFTAASGPVIYRGGLFGPEYTFNAFVPEPSANLIKRNILKESGYLIQGKQAYQGKEFLTSTDERFRPVSAYNGPDGALYVVDMYRGIIQHKTYLTDYLKSEIRKRELYQPNTCGRIYRVLPQQAKTEMPVFPSQATGLVALLSHPNGWVRDKAQQLLVDGHRQDAVQALRQLLAAGSPVASIHALWTLEGLGMLQQSDVLPLLGNTDWHIRMQALNVISSVIDKNSYAVYFAQAEHILQQGDTLLAPAIGYLAQNFRAYDAAAADRIVAELANKYSGNQIVADAVISNLEGKEVGFFEKFITHHPDTATRMYKQFQIVLNNIREASNDKNTKISEQNYPKGALIFNTVCQPCHGPDGSGVKGIGPPLNKSQWVTGQKEKLIPILLFGLTGPIEVNGKIYKIPEVSGEMPGIGQNDEFGNEDIAQLLSFIRNAWSNSATVISAAEVQKIRDKYKGRQKSFTAAELLK